MDQELLLNICKTLVVSENENAMEILKKTIEDNNDVIIDRKDFYTKLISCLVIQILSYTTIEANGKKMVYLEELISENLVVLNNNNDFKKILTLLCQYNDDRVNNLLIKVLGSSKLKGCVKEYLSDMGRYYHNITLVDFVIEKKLLNNKMLESLVAAVKEINFKAQIEFKNLECSNPLETSQTLGKIGKIKNQHKLAAQALIKIFNNLGKDVQITNDLFHQIICEYPELNEDFHDLFANIDDYNNNLDYIDLIDCLSWGKSDSLINLLINMGKVPRTELGDSKHINQIVNIFLDKINKEIYINETEERFLEDVLNSHAIYNLHAKNLVGVVEYLYGTRKRIPNDLVIEFREDYEKAEKYNPNNNGELGTEMDYVVKPITEVGHNVEHFLEQLLKELLLSNYSDKYEQSILRILNEEYLDMNYNTLISNNVYSKLPYVICTYGSNEVIKNTMEQYELPTYMSSDLGNTDLFKIYTKLEEYDKALEIFNNEEYELVDHIEKYSHSDYGQYYIFQGELYVDNLIVIVETLCQNKNEKSLEFLNQILQSPKLTHITASSLERIIYLYRHALDFEQEAESLLNQILLYIKQKIKNNELIFYVFDTNAQSTNYSGLKTVKPEEVEDIFTILESKPEGKKLVLPSNVTNETK